MFPDLKKIAEDAIKPFKSRIEEVEKQIKECNEKTTEILTILKTKQ